MATASVSTKKIPLPVALFYGAMERQQPFADYAKDIDLAPDLFRQALSGRLQGADSHPLDALAKAINRDPAQVDLAALPSCESFSMWLKRNMEGITQHGLQARAQLDRQTLKRFLNGDLLPDSDQAERISRALYIDRMEIARVVTANMAAAAPAITSHESPEPGAPTPAGQSGASSRRRRASPRYASAEPAALLSAAIRTTLDETAWAKAEPDMAATGEPPKAAKRLKRAPKPDAQALNSVVPAMAAHQPHGDFAFISAAEAQEANQGSGSAPAAPADQALQPSAQSPRPRKSRAGRQPDQAPASGARAAVDTSTSIERAPQPAVGAYPASQPAAATAAEQADALPPAPANKAEEAIAQRPKRPAPRGIASIAAAEQTPNETALAADGGPGEAVAAEGKSASQARSRRPRAVAATAVGIPSGAEVASTLAAEVAPPKLDVRSAPISGEQTAPPITAELAADTTTLQLSPDEVRLVRHWRQLHPHGRRATLHYIGSLLVDD